MAVRVLLEVSVRGPRSVLDVLPVVVLVVFMLSVRLDRPGRTVFRSTTREAEEVFGSMFNLLALVDRSLVAICLRLLSLVFVPTSIIFIRDVRFLASDVDTRAALVVFRFEARP
jgi:hypothetical protein